MEIPERGHSAGGEQGDQATAVLDSESAGLVYHRGGGVPAAQHRRRGGPVLQLPSRPAGDDSQPHRRSGGSGPASGEPLHGAAMSSFGCASADSWIRFPTGVSSWTLELQTASFHIDLLYLPRARSCMGQRVSLFLAGETAW